MGDVNSDSSLLHLQQQDATVTNTASSIHPVIPPPLLISRADSHAGTTGSTMHVATARALTPMRRPRDDPLSSFNTDGETQAMPSQRRTDLMAPAQTGIWALVPYVALAVVTAGVGWILKKRFVARQERLVEEFGEVMVQYGTTPDARVEIASEYKRKLGPGILRGAMFASFLHCLISEKAIVPATISDVASVKRLLKLSDARVVSAVNRLATQLEVAPSLLGKLLFISSRIIDDPSYTLAPAAPPAAVPEDMQQLKKEKKKSKAVSSSHLDIVPLFPYSAETVADLQRNMLERCYKEYCDDEIELHAVDTPPLEAAAILRLDQRDAETLFDTVVAQRARRKEEELAKLAAEAAERATKQDEVTELDSPARSGEPAKANVHAYQCSDCGYTLFPAAGREFKFYGDDFVCPACGAPKDKFVDLNADD